VVGTVVRGRSQLEGWMKKETTLVKRYQVIVKRN
jgi:hypothetical protein